VSRHLDLDDLADLLAGEGAAAEVRHVAGCPACSSALDDLDEAQRPVRAALAALPEPAVPSDLAARLDAALLAAREQEDAAPAPADVPPARAGPAGPAGPATVVPLHRPRRRIPPERLLTAAAGIVLLLVVGVAALAVSRQGTGGDSSTSSSAGSAAGPAAARGVPTSSTGADYGSGRDALAAALPQLLRGGTDRRQFTSGAASGEAEDPLARLRDPTELAGCLSGLFDPAGGDPAALGPVALDYARYAGRPALVTVLPASDPTRLDVYVLGAGCRAGSPETLLSTSLARPS